MAPKVDIKPKRQKKRKSRTQVTSDSESSSDEERREPEPNSPAEQADEAVEGVRSAGSSAGPKALSDGDVQNLFTKYLMQRATIEFADDLNAIRESDDFKGASSLQLLVKALEQGNASFTTDEQRRVVCSATKSKDTS
ncbi:hypothetical protein BP6252_09316 [Coleophoma cylindrospora]|uniref:Ribosome assembly protein 3 n=1 Tax=Coleophoma cylindrospora TaxID=1849047 RepID=A0A3D8R1V0_9HELO|nr:hypothetical protein BP6252_09316 [Coleophoma cylindrospora]